MGIKLGLANPERSLRIVGLLLCVGLMGHSGLLPAQEATETEMQEAIEPEATSTEDIATETPAVQESQTEIASPEANPRTPATQPQSTGQARGNRVVSLQTTVTGNQEQPRVLYLIPWQSPRASDADFEQFDGLQTPVFGHLERDEFRRELEARGEFD